jgi:hypothetical protein
VEAAHQFKGMILKSKADQKLGQIARALTPRRRLAQIR